MSTTKTLTTFFLRPNMHEVGAPMQAPFKLLGISCVLFMDGLGNLAIHKMGLKNIPHKKPLAVGRIGANKITTENAPDLVGYFTTAKNTRFDVSMWFHEDHTGEYYVVRYSEPPKPKGSVFRPANFSPL